MSKKKIRSILKKSILSLFACSISYLPLHGSSLMEGNIAEAGEAIEINLAAHTLTFLQDGVPTHMYNIAVGKPSTPTPQGSFEISNKAYDPSWTNPKTGETIESGPYNPLGYRWMGLYGNYGIHGNNNPDSIGHNVSNGCIRMYEEDVEELFEMVPYGTPVEIYYERLVVEQDSNNQIVYYIYPDGYGYEPLDVYTVNEEIKKKGYGIHALLPDSEIEQKIWNEDGEPTYIGRIYNVELIQKNGSKKEELPWKAYSVDRYDDVLFPAWEVAKIAKANINWNQEAGTLTSAYGTVRGFNEKDVLFVKGSDIPTLFRVQVFLDQTTGFYNLKPM